MADTKISALTDIGANLTADDLIAVVQDPGGTPLSRKATLTALKELLWTLGMPHVTRLDSDHAISSTTGTEVTDLSQTLAAGTYMVQYHLIVQSATTTVGPMFGVNFTGTAAVKTFLFAFGDGSTALTAYTANMDDEGVKGLGVVSGMNTKTYSTTAPNLGTTVGVTTINVDIGAYIFGTLIVTAQGDLELWHSSETATSTTLKTGSSLSTIRTDLG